MNRSIRVRGLRDAPGGRADDPVRLRAGNGLNLAKVSGKVMYKGQPVKNGTVFFMPDEAKGTVGPPAVGSITSDGSYVMSTETAGDGAIVGHHKVGITGVEPVSDRPSARRSSTLEKDAGGYMKAKSKAAAQASQGRRQEGRGDLHRQGRQEIPLRRPHEILETGGIRHHRQGRRSQTVNFDIDESGNVRISP